MARAGKLAKEKVSHLFLSKGKPAVSCHTVDALAHDIGVEISHIKPLREAARALAAEAIRKSGQF
jgi:hypothetical protein